MSEYIVELNDNAVSGGKFLLGSVYLDATQIVRCRDCIYMHTVRNWLGMDMGECWLRADRESGALGKERTEPDGFCAWAIRKEGGDD